MCVCVCVCSRMLLPSFIISALMSLTDYLLLFFSCQGLKVYGAWLQKHSPADLWFLRVLVNHLTDPTGSILRAWARNI